jgi:prevent-host-death family protein
MVNEVTAVKFRQNLGEMIARVQYSNDAIVINKAGKPAAALIDPVLYGRIRRMWDNFDALTGTLAKAYEGVPEEDGLAEIDAAATAVRAERTA